MRRKKVLFAVVIIFPGILVLYFKYIAGWMSFRRNTDTPVEFLSQTLTSKENYTRDSVAIITQLKKSISKHEDFFHSTSYDEDTQLVVDSMVYSPDFRKIAIVVITKNATSKQLMPDKRYEWYYDATCFLGVREGDSVRLKWMGPVFTNSYDRQAISEIIREASFSTFATDDPLYRYNLNDTRFWTSPIWGKYFGQ